MSTVLESIRSRPCLKRNKRNVFASECVLKLVHVIFPMDTNVQFYENQVNKCLKRNKSHGFATECVQKCIPVIFPVDMYV